MSSAPPRLALWLLRRTLTPERYETVTGDLEEIFRLEHSTHGRSRAARRWFWRQTMSIIAARCLRRRLSRPASLLAPPRRGGRMQGLRQDIRYAIRTLLETPGFTFIAVLTLAFGIGGTTAIFTLVNGLLLKPLPYKAPSQLMVVHLLAPERGLDGPPRDLVWSYPKFQAFRANQRSFQDATLFTPTDWNVTGASSEPERVHGEIIDSRYLSVLGIGPQLGRDIRPEEDRAPGIAPIVLISHGLWQRRFGGDPNIIGQTVGLNLVPHTIIGVMPANFRGLTGGAEVWVPLMSSSNAGYTVDLNNAWSHSYFAVARRKADVSELQAKMDVELIGAQINTLFPSERVFGKATFGARAVSLDDSRLDALMRRAVYVLLGAVCAVLLIGCVNLANLLLARSLARQREVAIRLAIGATRLQIVRQFLTESAVLASAGAAGGLLVAFASMKLAGILMPEASMLLPRTFQLTRVGIGMIDLDWTTLLFALGTTVVTVLLFGLLPAWQASRADVTHAIKAGGAGSIGRGTQALSLRTLLIVAETALALVLLVGAGLMLRSVRNLQTTGLGFEPDGVITASVAAPSARYDNAHATQLLTQLLDRLRAQPGVQAAAYGSCAPVSGGCNGTGATFPDRELARGTEPMLGIMWASPGYFETMGITLVKGRTFTDRDRAGQPRVVILSETAARTFWPGEDPIGKRVRFGQGGFDSNSYGEVVGVVADVRYQAVETAPRSDAYLPVLQSPRSGGILFVRSSLDVAGIAPAIRAELRTLDPDLPVIDIKSMGRRFGDATWRTRLSADLLGVFAALALLLAAIGLYGVMAQGVEQRTREIGVRMALGADRVSIFRLVIGRALAIGAIGVIIGVALSLVSAQLLEALLYQVKPRDPRTIGLLALVLIAVTLLASIVPARRTTRVDPLDSLRAE
jgi:putative ABC transport system permease protein